jgi:hypothetical protein
MGSLFPRRLGLLADQVQDARGVDHPDEAAVEAQAHGPAESLLVAVEQDTRVGDAAVSGVGALTGVPLPRSS